MRVAGVREFRNRAPAFLKGKDLVFITRHGKPAALIIGVEGEAFEDLMTRSDPEFWQMIEARRAASKTISSHEMRRRLSLPRRRRPKRKH